MTQRSCAGALQLDADRARAGASRRHYEQLLRLAALSRRGRLDATPVTAGERTALDMIWRQRARYRRLELFLENVKRRRRRG